MIEATSCGGVVIFRGKILVLYKNYKSKYEGWVLPREPLNPERSIGRQRCARYGKKQVSRHPL